MSDQAVQADGRQDESENAEYAHDRRHHPLSAERASKLLVKRARGRKDELRIELANGAAQRWNQGDRIVDGPHMKSHTRFVVLRERYVEKRRPRLLDRARIHGVGNNSDDLPRAPAGVHVTSERI